MTTSISDDSVMKQATFSDAEFAEDKKQTRRDRFLAEIDAVTPWPTPVGALMPTLP
jgi:transposase, IS5 family